MRCCSLRLVACFMALTLAPRGCACCAGEPAQDENGVRKEFVALLCDQFRSKLFVLSEDEQNYVPK